MNQLVQAIDTAIGSNIAKITGVSAVAVHKWKTRGLPTSDYTGKTEYWRVISTEARKKGMKITKQQLFDASNELKNKEG